MSRTPYPTDLTDRQWRRMKPWISINAATGRPSKYTKREIVNAILYVTRNGCTRSSATGSARRRARQPNQLRRFSIAKPSRRPNKAGRVATKPGKKVLGCKRHLVVDSLGLVWTLVVTPASVQDRDGAKLALEAFRESVKSPKVIWADTAYRSVVDWAWIKWLWPVEIVTRPRGRFVLQKKRWSVERTFGWLNRSRRLAKSFERTPESDTAFIRVAMIHLMVKRLV